MIRLFLNVETERRQAFLTFALVGLASLWCVQVLWFVPVIWLVMLANLQVLTIRVWAASFLGLIVPYWFAVPYILHEKFFDLPSQHFDALTRMGEVSDFSHLSFVQLLIFACVVVMSLSGIIYYFRHNHYDRLRLRQTYSGYAILFLFSLILFILQPQLYWVCLTFVVVNGTPFVARTIAWIF